MTGALRQGGPRVRLGLDGWWVGVVAGVRRGVGVGVVAAKLGTPAIRLLYLTIDLMLNLNLSTMMTIVQGD